MTRLIVLVILLTVTTVGDAIAQSNRRARKETKASMNDQASRKEARVSNFDEQLEAGRKAHMQKQTKKTRKRMKANRKRSERIDKGTHLPFYKRWFRKRHFK